MKTCRSCNQLKPTESFGLYARNRDGLKSYCKPCENAKIAANRSKPEIRARRIAYDKLRNESAAVKAAAAARKATPQGKAATARAVAAYVERNPVITSAHRAVRNALRRGELHRFPCFVCGGKSEAHHPDYSAPLAVVWLCRTHHVAAHALSRQGGTS